MGLCTHAADPKASTPQIGGICMERLWSSHVIPHRAPVQHSSWWVPPTARGPPGPRAIPSVARALAERAQNGRTPYPWSALRWNPTCVRVVQTPVSCEHYTGPDRIDLERLCLQDTGGPLSSTCSVRLMMDLGLWASPSPSSME